MDRGNIARHPKAKIVGLIDVDENPLNKVGEQFPDAKRYRDFREMFAAEGDKIDAVYCGTPDHTHAIIAAAAMELGKQWVYPGFWIEGCNKMSYKSQYRPLEAWNGKTWVRFTAKQPLLL